MAWFQTIGGSRMSASRMALLVVALLPLAAAAASHRWSPLAEGEGSRGSLQSPRLQVGVVRAAPKGLPALAWEAEGDAWVSRFDAVSEGALGLRARLALDGTGPLELRVRGADGVVETMTLPAGTTQAWGPWTSGGTQVLEAWSESARAAPCASRASRTSTAPSMPRRPARARWMRCARRAPRRSTPPSPNARSPWGA